MRLPLNSLNIAALNDQKHDGLKEENMKKIIAVCTLIAVSSLTACGPDRYHHDHGHRGPGAGMGHCGGMNGYCRGPGRMDGNMNYGGMNNGGMGGRGY